MQYMIRMGWFALNSFNELGKPVWIQPASFGHSYNTKDEAEADLIKIKYAKEKPIIVEVSSI